MTLPLPAPLPFLSPALGSHMVLQRDRPNSFWGWTTPGERVTVSVGEEKASGVAGSDGKWTVRFTPPKVGGPYVVAVDGSRHVRLDDVLVGDVWLCTGQSNMEFGLTMENGGTQAVADANDPELRLFLAPHQSTLTPQPTNGGTWKVCTPTTVAEDGWGGFSAVGYHFGKALRREVGVPIGLVEVVWGGTNAESWTSREALHPLRDFDDVFPKIDAAATSSALPDGSNDPGSQPGANWGAMDLDTTGWKPVAVPDGFAGLDLAAYDGTAWFRKEVTLSEAQAVGAATLDLGVVDDYDVTWINGVKIADQGPQNSVERHAIPAGTLRPGRNVIAVRVLDTGGAGGFTSNADAIGLSLGDGTRIPLAGTWLGHVGAALPLSGPNVPTSLYDGMIAPELPLAIRGAIWYQGENNASRAVQYRRILPAMIADWRSRFRSGDFPFYVVSLAAFGPHRDVPGDDEWAELREAQALTATNVRNAGLAMAIDVGDAGDIHPKEKRTVGERLALLALARTYGRNVVDQGPTYRSLSIRGDVARVTFDHIAGGLTSRGGPPGEFALAGADRKWHRAQARIEGDAVLLTSPEVPKPVAARYAWQSNPVATLANGAGLPAIPFRTDDWPEITAGRK